MQSEISEVEVSFDGSVEELRRYVLRFCAESYNWPDTIALGGGLDRTEDGVRFHIVERRPATDEERRARGIPDSAESVMIDGAPVGTIEIVRVTSKRSTLICKSLSADCQRFMDALVQKIVTQKLNAGDVLRRLPTANGEQDEPQADSDAVSEPRIVVTDPLPLDMGIEAFKNWLTEYQVVHHPSSEPSVCYTPPDGNRVRLHYRFSNCWIDFEATVVAPGKLTITKMTCSPHYWKDYFERLIGAIPRRRPSTSLPQADSSAVSEQATAAEDQDSSLIKILFLAANPADRDHLRLDAEMRAIDLALQRAAFRDRFDLKQHWAVQVTDLQLYLLRHRPDIVHFSGHGSISSEIILEDDSGNSRPVSVRALSTLFSILKDNIKCVVLNACYSEQQAQAIAQSIDCVIGMSKAIGDDAAIGFAAAFYQALGFGRDVKTAFELGCVQIDLEGLDEQDTPKLLAMKISPENILFIKQAQ